MSKTATLANVTSDPHLELLLGFMLGRDSTEDYAALMLDHATRGASALLQSNPFFTAFDDYADRPDVYSLVSDAVEALLTRPSGGDPDLTQRRAAALVAIRGVREDGSNELRVDGGNCGALGQSVLIDHATAGLLLGAAVMYGLLKGGAQ